MAARRKVTTVSPPDETADARSSTGAVWRDTEDSELDKLSRGAWSLPEQKGIAYDSFYMHGITAY